MNDVMGRDRRRRHLIDAPMHAHSRRARGPVSWHTFYGTANSLDSRRACTILTLHYAPNIRRQAPFVVYPPYPPYAPYLCFVEVQNADLAVDVRWLLT